MPDTDGVSLLKEWHSQGLLDMPVVMMSGHATVDTAVEATRIGAVDFLEKPITMEKLLKAVAAGLARPVVSPAMLAAARGEAPPPPRDGKRAAASGPAVAGASGAGMAGTAAATEAVAAAAPVHDPSMLGDIPLDQPLRDARDEFERVYFEYHLAQENYSMTRVSEATGLERTHLYRKLKQLGIDASARRRNR